MGIDKLFSSFWYSIKSIFLFPIHLLVAALWSTWNFAFGGFYVGCPPIFWDKDRFVLFLKETKSKFCLIRHDLKSHKEEVIFESKLPIEHFGLHGSELKCHVYYENEWRCNIVDLHNLSNTVRVLPGESRFGRIFLPESIGFIKLNRIYSDSGCFNQIIKVTESTEEILENNLDDFAYDISISRDERYLAYSTKLGIYVIELATGKQEFYQSGKSRIYNWNTSNELLGYDGNKRLLLVINPNKAGPEAIELPYHLRNKTVWKASISPSGKAIVYQALGRKPGAKGDGPIILYSLLSQEHGIISDKVTVYGIEWAENEELISIAGVNKRDLFDISYGYKMRNATYHDKEIIDIDGNLITRLQ
jgi:hypothetical protein